MTKSIAEAVKNAASSRAKSWRSPLGKLTLRQREVLQLLAEGLCVKAIAIKLNVSPRTAVFHKYLIMEELGLHSAAEVGRYAARHVIVT